MIVKDIIYYSLNNIKEVKKNENKEFRSFFSELEYKDIMGYYLNDSSKKLYDGFNTRIDAIIHENDGDVLVLSDITFYDYMTSNILLLHRKKIVDYMCEKGKTEVRHAIQKFYDLCDKISTSNEILDTKCLSNLAAVSVLICDVNGKYGVVKRGGKTAVSAGFWAVSVTGCIENRDFQNSNPIVECCVRETKEELNIDLVPENVVVRGVSFDNKKLQPIILCDVKIEETWENIIHRVDKGVEYSLEVDEIHFVTEEEIPSILQYTNMTAASRVHFQLHCSKEVE